MIISHLNPNVQTQAQHLNSYGWYTFDAYEIDETIYVGDTVYYYDDETDTSGWGVYKGFYQDMPRKQNPDGDTSPYFSEAYEGIDRVVIQETIVNPDGSFAVRRNYILPENITNQPQDIGIIAEWVNVA